MATQDHIQTLRELAQLRDEGVITSAQFEQQRESLLTLIQQTHSPRADATSSSEGVASAVKLTAPPLIVPPPTGPVTMEPQKLSEVFPPAVEPIPASERAPESASLDFFATGGGVAPSAPAGIVLHMPEPLPPKHPVAPLSLEAGTVLLERYRLDRKIGEGGMGVVFQGTDLVTDQTYAIKVVHPELAQDEGIRARFMQEQATNERLTHPSIVRSFALHQETEHHLLFFTMEYVEGTTLDQTLQGLRERNELTPVGFVQKALCDLAEALVYTHKQGVIHRDLKPSNVVIFGDGSCKVMDFGIAKVVADNANALHTGFVGTPYYMAPEQLRGGTEASAAADVFSLGVIAYEMLTNQIPMGRFPRPSVIRRSVPAYLDQIVMTALAQDPKERFPSMEAMLEALQRQSLGKHAPLPASAFRPPPMAASPARNLATRRALRSLPVKGSRKSPVMAFLLCLCFGVFGLLYVSGRDFIMGILALIGISLITFGLGGFFVWFGSAIYAYRAVSQQNKERRQALFVSR